MQDRIKDYRWNVEHITANSDRELALLYERYNSSGKTMSPVQIGWPGSTRSPPSITSYWPWPAGQNSIIGTQPG